MIIEGNQTTINPKVDASDRKNGLIQSANNCEWKYKKSRSHEISSFLMEVIFQFDKIPPIEKN